MEEEQQVRHLIHRLSRSLKHRRKGIGQTPVWGIRGKIHGISPWRICRRNLEEQSTQIQEDGQETH